VERFNKVVEEMLRHFVSPMHDDWDEFLDCAEFAFNKSYSTSLKCSPWELVHPFQPLSPPEYELIQGLPLRKSPAGKRALSRWLMQYTNAKECMHIAKQAAQSRQSQKRSHRSFLPGDFVMVNTKYIKLKTPQSSTKFTPRFVGPFPVLERIGRSAYRLQLPSHCRMHPVIHVSKLWKYYFDPELTTKPPPPIVLEDEEYWRVEAVIGVRGSKPRRQFLVRWQGFDSMHDTWEPETELESCRDEIDKFFQSRQAHQRVMLLLASPTVPSPPDPVPQSPPLCLAALVEK
jgi:hypothetical protein